MPEMTPMLSWTLQREIPIPDDVRELLVDGEQAVAAFQTFRDSATFTTKRLIVRDAQGLTGKKIEIYSLPYSAINMWSSENAARPRRGARIMDAGWADQSEADEGRRHPAD